MNLEDKNVESSVDQGGLACEVSVQSKDYRVLCVKNLWYLVS